MTWDIGRNGYSESKLSLQLYDANADEHGNWTILSKCIEKKDLLENIYVDILYSALYRLISIIIYREMTFDVATHIK